MSVRTFFLGLSISFGLAWLLLLIAPYGSMADQRPIAYNPDLDERSGTFPAGLRPRIAEGSQIYLQEGCTQCHTQLIRPEYLGKDTFRKLASGTVDADGAVVVEPRASHPVDFLQVPFAPLGIQRVGPDLANVGERHSDKNWYFLHLFDPRIGNKDSIMPSYKHLFEVRPIVGQPSADALNLPEGMYEEGLEVVPTPRAKVLVDYLLQLRHDEPMPVEALSPQAQKSVLAGQN